MKNLDWAGLNFGYIPTDYNVRCYYRDGKWGEIETCSDEYLKLHMAATCLHYGQEAFEGLKAYRCPDGKMRVEGKEYVVQDGDVMHFLFNV